MSSGTMDAWLKRSGALALVVPLTLIAAGCGDLEIAAAPEPPRAAAITIEPALATLVSLGERAAFTATIADQYGAAYPGTVTWSGSDGAVFAVEAGGLVTAVDNGTATLTAAFEGVSATAEVVVRQVPASLAPVLDSGDEPAGAPDGSVVLVPAEASAWPVAVRVLDASGSPVAGAAVTFTAKGHGVADPGTATTGEGGIARTEWTPGAVESAQTLAAAYVGGPSVQVAATAGAAATDRAVLTALYNATGGPTWTRRENWLSAGPLADWYGIQVDTDGRVTSLALGANNLAGTIPGELGDLANLKILQLFGNNLTGAIPAQVGKLGNLEILFLDENDLSGRLPGELGQLGKLEWLWLNDNEDLNWPECPPWSSSTWGGITWWARSRRSSAISSTSRTCGSTKTNSPGASPRRSATCPGSGKSVSKTTASAAPFRHRSATWAG